MDALPVTERTRLRRKPERGSTDRAALYALLDEALVCHAGFVRSGSPVVIPLAYGRRGDTLYVHASTGAGMVAALGDSGTVCVTVTLLDGLVLARSAMHHSMNYRSAVIHGHARMVTDSDEKLAALAAITEHASPGRWAEVRHPTPRELAATAVLAVALDEASVKARTGPPIEDEADRDVPAWAGVVPVRLVRGTPQPDDARHGPAEGLGSSVPR